MSSVPVGVLQFFLPLTKDQKHTLETDHGVFILTNKERADSTPDKAKITAEQRGGPAQNSVQILFTKSFPIKEISISIHCWKRWQTSILKTPFAPKNIKPTQATQECSHINLFSRSVMSGSLPPCGLQHAGFQRHWEEKLPEHLALKASRVWVLELYRAWRTRPLYWMVHARPQVHWNPVHRNTFIGSGARHN